MLLSCIYTERQPLLLVCPQQPHSIDPALFSSSPYLSEPFVARQSSLSPGPADETSINKRNYRDSKRKSIPPRRDRSRTSSRRSSGAGRKVGKVFHRVCTSTRARALVTRVREKRDSTRKLRGRTGRRGGDDRSVGRYLHVRDRNGH